MVESQAEATLKKGQIERQNYVHVFACTRVCVHVSSLILRFRLVELTISGYFFPSFTSEFLSCLYLEHDKKLLVQKNINFEIGLILSHQLYDLMHIKLESLHLSNRSSNIYVIGMLPVKIVSIKISGSQQELQ